MKRLIRYCILAVLLVLLSVSINNTSNTYAGDTYTVVPGSTASLITGSNFNAKIKSLVKPSATYQTIDKTITSIEWTNIAPEDGVNTVKISSKITRTDTDVIAYLDGTVVKLYSTAETIYAGERPTSMFADFCEVEKIDISRIKFSASKSLMWMFKNDKKLKQIIGIESINISSCDEIYQMFYDCDSLTELDLSNWRGIKNNLKINNCMVFSTCDNLQKIKMFDTSNLTADNLNIFPYFKTYIIDNDEDGVSDDHKLYTKIKKDVSQTYIWANVSQLVDGKTFNITIKQLVDSSVSSVNSVDTTITSVEWTDIAPAEGVTTKKISESGPDILAYLDNTTIKLYYNPIYTDLLAFNKDCSYMFYNLTKFNSFTLIPKLPDNYTIDDTLIADTDWYSHQMENVSYMFGNCYSLTSFDMKSLYEKYFWFNNMKGMFSYCTNLTEINGINYVRFTRYTDITYLFEHCEKLESLDLEGWGYCIWDEDNYIHNFSHLFDGCINLKNLNVEDGYVFCYAYDMSYTFNNCKSLTNLDLSGLTLDINRLEYIYDEETIESSSFPNAVNIAGLFNGCENLETIDCDFTTWNVSNVTDFSKVFNNTKITELDISTWNITVEEPFNNTFPSTLEKIKMCNTANISEDNLKNLFANNMVLDNDEDGIGDDSVLRKDVIKDINDTDKQIYIKYVAPYTLVTGKNFNAKVKSLVKPSATYQTADTTITSIEWTDIAPADGVTTVNVSKAGADIIAYLDGTVVKLYTISDTVYLNEDSSFMFYNFTALETLPMTETKLDTSNVTNFEGMFYCCETLTSLALTGWQVTNKCTKLNIMFTWCENLELTCDFTTWDVSNVTDFSGMFAYCKKLTSLALTGWQVTDKCTNLNTMFSLCENLENLNCDFTTWNVSNVTDFAGMFQYCSKLKSLNLSTWNVSNGIVFNAMFVDCKNLTTLNLGNWHVSNKCTSLGSMFNGCSSLETINCDFSTWDVSNVTTFGYMFCECKKLTTLNLTNWQVTNKCTYLRSMFYDCKNLETLTCDFTTWDVSNVTTFADMFLWCAKLTSLDLTGCQVTNKCTNLSYMFMHCENLEILTCDFNTWDVSNVTSFEYMFQSCEKLVSLDINNWQVTNKCNSLENMFCYCDKLEKLKMFNTCNISSEDTLKNLFTIDMMLDNNEDGVGDDGIARKDAIKDTNSTDKQIYIKYALPPATLIEGANFNAKVKSLVKLPSTYLTIDTTITSIEWTTIAPAEGITTVKLSESGSDVIGYLDGTVVKLYTLTDTIYLNEDSSRMFYNFESLTTVPFLETKINSSTLTDLTGMFNNCRNIISLDLTNLDVSNVTSFYYMFSLCIKLTSLDLSNWQVTNKCTNLTDMFANCQNLEDLNCTFTTWNVSNVTNFNGMFNNCEKLTSIDISTWQFNEDDLGNMFTDCNSLIELKLPTNASVTNLNETFKDCYKLPEIDLSNWAINIQDKGGLEATFQSCRLATIKLPTTINFNKCASFHALFSNCTKLTEMPECFKQPNLDLTNIKYFTSMFEYTGLTSVDLSNWITSNNAKKYNRMFSLCYYITEINGLNQLNMEGLNSDGAVGSYVSYGTDTVVYPLEHMFSETDITELDISGWNINIEEPFDYTFSFMQNLEKIKMCNTSNISEDNLTNLFYNDMTLDNDENDVSDDRIARKDAIKDSNTTDKQIYIKYVADYSILTTGANFNAKVKSLVKPSATYLTYDTTITSVEWTDVAPAEGVTVVKLSESGSDVIGYLDNTIVKLYTTVDTVYLNENSSYMFIRFQALESLSVVESRINTSNVTDFSSMFSDCKKLTTLNLNNWQVTNKCTSLYSMFENCEKLEIIICDFTTWDISNVTNFGYMFSQCRKVTTLNLSNWQVTDKCNILYDMFFNCNKLENLICDFTTWDVSNVTNFNNMFSNCNKLPSLDLSTWVINNANIDSMFAYDSNLDELKLPSIALVTNLNNTFAYCYKLSEIDLSNWNINIQSASGLQTTFYNCFLATIKLPNTINFNKCESFYGLFYNCEKLTEIPECFKQPNLDLTNIKYFGNMFASTSLTSIDLCNWTTSSNAKMYNSMFCDCANLTTITGLDHLNMEGLTNPTDEIAIRYSTYYNCKSLESMFKSTKITELDISTWNITIEEPFDKTFPSTLEKIKMCNTSNISDDNLKNLFSNDMLLDNNEDGIGDDSVLRKDAIKDVNLTDKQIYIKVNVSTLITGSRFNIAIKQLVDSAVIKETTDDTTITSIEWTTVAPSDEVTTKQVSSSGSLVTAYLDGTVVKLYTTADIIILNSNSYAMFSRLHALESLPILETKIIDTSNVTMLRSIFYGCEKIASLDLSNWNVSNCTDFNFTFGGCKQLTSLNISNWQVTNKCTSLAYMFNECENLETINCDFTMWDVSKVTNFSGMFEICLKLTTLDLTNWRVTDKCTALAGMFNYCQNLETLTSNFNTWDVSNVTDFYLMFQSCKKLTSIDISNWNINNASISYMFASCSNLTEIKLPNTAYINNMNYTFSDCSKLTEINLSNWTIDIQSADGLQNTFYNCKHAVIKLPDIVNFNKCESFYSTFKNCKKLTEMPKCFKQPNLDLTNIKYFCNMFNGTGLISVDLSNWVTSSNAKMYTWMFQNCTSLTQITGLDHLNTEGLSEPTKTVGISITNSGAIAKPLQGMFDKTKVTELDISSWVINQNTAFHTNTFTTTLEKLKMCNTSNIDESNLIGIFPIDLTLDNNEDSISDDDVIRRDAIKDINSTDKQIYITFKTSKLIKGSNFNIAIKQLVNPSASTVSSVDTTITSIEWTNVVPADGVTTVNVSQSGADIIAYLDSTVVKLYTPASVVTLDNSCYAMFQDFSNLITIPMLESKITNIDNVTSCQNMFLRCKKLTTLDLSNFKITNNCKYLHLMFQDCENLESITGDFTIWDTSNVIKINQMFYNCKKLTLLDLSTWDISKVDSLISTFNSCESLTTLKLTGWQITNKCTNLSGMFYNCYNLETLNCDFTTWNVSNVTTFKSMFIKCEKLTTLDLSNWQVTNKCTDLSYMFSNCNNLETLTCDFNTWDTSNVTKFGSTFYTCNKLNSIDISNWIINNANIDSMFSNSVNLEYIKLPSIASVTSLYSTFAKCKKLQEINLSNWTIDIQTTYGLEGTFNDCRVAEIKLPSTINFNKCESFTCLFAGCEKLIEMPSCFKQSNLDFTNIKYFTSMFNEAGLTSSVNLSNWNTSSNAKIYAWMFCDCTNLTVITGLNNLNMEGLTNPTTTYIGIKYMNATIPSALRGMFNGTKITELDISDWNITIDPFSDTLTTFPETLEKIKMCNTSNISDDNLKNLFSNDMMLDNNEDYIGDDWVLRKDAIKDTNDTDKQIYIKKDFGITLDYNGGTYNEESNKVIYGSSNATSIPTDLIPVPVKENSIFKGFYDADNNLLDTTIIPTTDKTYIAIYEASEYTISYLGITDTTADKEYKTTYTSSDEDYTLPTLSKTGYIFKGWVGNGITTPTTPYILVSGSTGNKVFTAEFEPITYTIYIHSNDLTDSNGNHIGDTEVKTVTMEYNDWNDSFDRLSDAIEEMTNSGYILASDSSDYVSYLVTCVDDNDKPINGTFNDSSIRDCYGDNYGHIMINGYRKTNLTNESNKEYHFYIINTINNVRVLNPNINDVYGSNCHKIYYGNKLVFFMPNIGVDLMPVY